jgi:hypothetical protein
MHGMRHHSKVWISTDTIDPKAMALKHIGRLALKTLMKPENEAEANVIKAILEEHGIYAEKKSCHDTAYDGLFQSQYGWGLIRVAEKDLPEARRIIEEWLDAAPGELPWENRNPDY